MISPSSLRAIASAFLSVLAVVHCGGTDDDGGPSGGSGQAGVAGAVGGGGSGAEGGGGGAGMGGKAGGGGTGAASAGAAGAGAGAAGAGAGAAGAGAAGAAGAGGKGCAASTEIVPALALTPVVTSGLTNSLLVKAAPGDSTRLYVVEQTGKIKVIESGVLRPTPFLDLSALLQKTTERGLLGLAFHPGFAQNRRFFVHYSGIAGGFGSKIATTGDTVIAEYKASSADIGDAASAKLVLTVPQPEENHDGGSIEFSPTDGMLYIALGDGGGGGDQHGTIGNGQDLTTLLGKILRIDVSALPYTIPPGNMTGPGVRPEIWDYGLRNPWRASFDSCNGALYIGDVGQNIIEEINVEPAGTGHRNYGWRLKEGPQCYEPASACDPGGLTDPVAWYDHTVGKAVTGGYVYRGTRTPALFGTYFYADYQSGRVFSFRWDGTNNPQKVTDRSAELAAGINVSSFGQDNEGEVYMVDLSGGVYRIDTKGAPPP